MYAASKIKQLSLSETNFRGVPEAPTTPGVYWFHRQIGSRAILVEVRATNGELTLWWSNEDQSITKLKGHWRGLIPPSSGTGSR